MIENRHLSASTLDINGDLWVIGGIDDNIQNQTDNSVTTEVYEYRPEGNGLWRSGYELPGLLRDFGIQSQCVLQINSSHVFMAGGFSDVARNCDKLTDQLSPDGNDVNPRNQDSEGPDSVFDPCRYKGEQGAVEFNFTDPDFFNGGGRELAVAWMYNGITNSWRLLPSMSTPRDRPGCSLLPNDEDGSVCTYTCWFNIGRV